MLLLKKLLTATRPKASATRELIATRGTAQSSVDANERARVIEAAGANVAGGRYAAALASIDAALTKTPDDGELMFARASALFSWGRYIEAYAAQVAAARSLPTKVALETQTGWALFWIGRLDESIASMRRAIELAPDDWAANFGLASVLRANNRAEEALAFARRAVELNPDDLYCVAGVISCEVELGRLDAAETRARRATELHSERSMAWSNLGSVLDHQDRYDEALAAYHRAHTLELESPESQDDYVNHVTCLLRAARTQEAIALLEDKLPRYPDARAHGHYALALLTAGRLLEGWKQYEFRWMKAPLSSWRPNFVKPSWTGQDLQGKTILLRTEQGHGDFFQFIRYAPIIKALGARVLLQIREEVRGIAALLPDIDEILAPNTPYPPFDYYVNLLSVPRALGNDLAAIPAEVPYLRPDPVRMAEWAERVPQDELLNVGLVWAGSPGHLRDRFRSLTLASLAPLADIDGVRFHFLQKGPAAAEAAAPPDRFKGNDQGPLLRDFSDTAALLSQLDLLIGVDTSVVHLAAGLGKPVWVLLPTPADFRWLEDREDSPWYPTMRLFRQRQLGDWEDVIARVKAALAMRVQQRVSRVSDVDQMTATIIGNVVQRPLGADVARTSKTLSQVAQTRAGLMQFFPGQPLVGTSIERYGEYRQLQLDRLLSAVIPGATLIEAGAGVGAHAIPLGARLGFAGHVILYESDELLRRVLQQNLHSGNVTNATLMRRVLGGSRCEGQDTIDELRLERLDWIKLGDRVPASDTLEGAVEALWHLRPNLFIELADEAEFERAGGARAGFRICVLACRYSAFQSRELQLVQDRRVRRRDCPRTAGMSGRGLDRGRAGRLGEGAVISANELGNVGRSIRRPSPRSNKRRLHCCANC